MNKKPPGPGGPCGPTHTLGPCGPCINSGEQLGTKFISKIYIDILDKM
jgi:hypothetical protein